MATASDVGVRALMAGRLVVHPTDTLYALAARAADRTAVARVVAAKGRPTGQPLSVSVSSVEELDRWARLSVSGRSFARRRLPGPFTVLARPTEEARRRLAPEVARAPRIGLRVPAHPLARELARRAGPLVATSANRSGEPPCRSLADARRTFGTEVTAYLAVPPRPSGVASTLVDLAGARPREVPRR